MDRRRPRSGFVPSSEDLEVRQLLSTAAAPPTADVPAPPKLPRGVTLATLSQKQLRIERLPAFLHSLDPSRPLPPGLTQDIQNNLTQLVGKLQSVPSAGLSDFNRQLRDLLGRQSVSAQAAAQLNASFGKILLTAGAPPTIAAGLQADLDTLAHIDIKVSNEPTSLLANDYAAIIQTALAVGRPLPAPAPATLLPADDTGPKGDRATSVTQPTLTGTYEAGTIVRILDTQNHILGSAPTGTDGKYAVTFDQPLSEGRQVLKMQAITPTGAPSLASKAFAIRIVPASPAGPLALRR